MKKQSLPLVLLTLSLLFTFFTACKKEDKTPPPTVPVLTTAAISGITQSSARSGGTITSDGGAPITVSGVCWSTSATPTINDHKTSDGLLSGTFSNTLTGLSSNTTYYVCAYATNSVGTGYGNIISFTTH